MSDTRSRAPALDDVRIRLEGALDAVEAATGRCRRARSLLGRRFRTTVGGHRELFEQLRAQEAENEAAAEKVLELGRREEWLPDVAPLRIVDAYRRARAELAARIDALLGAQQLPELVASLEALLAEAIDPNPGPVLLSIPLAKRNQPSLVSAAIGLSLMVALAGASGPADARFVAMVFIGSLLLALPWALSGGRVELYADRLRLRGRLLHHEVSLRPRDLVHAPVAAQVRATNPTPQIDVSVNGLPWFRLNSAADAELLDGVFRLLRSPPFEAPRSVAASPVVLTAWWVNPLAPNEAGVLALLDDRAWFIADGETTYAAVDVQPRLQSAAPLAHALASIGRERREPLLKQLLAQDRVREIDVAALGGARLARGRLALPGSQVQAIVPKHSHREVAVWLWRAARRSF